MNITQEKDSLHWATKYIGKRWSTDWHCWTLVSDAYQDALGIELPWYPSAWPNNLKQGLSTIRGVVQGTSETWREVETPQEFDAVAMATGKTFTHVGIWTEDQGGRVVHVNRYHPCIVSTIDELKRVHMVKQIKFFRWHTL